MVFHGYQQFAWIFSRMIAVKQAKIGCQINQSSAGKPHEASCNF